MSLGKVLTGLAMMAAAPIAATAVIHVAATAGAVAVVNGFVSSSTVVSAGATAATATARAVTGAGARRVAGGIRESLD